MTGEPRPSRLRRPRATLAALAVVGVTVLAITGGLAACSLIGGGTVDTVGKVPFDRPLAIPPIAAMSTNALGEKVVDLTAATGTSSFLPGKRTTTWGFNGAYLGPTIVASRGDRLRVNVTNDLPEATTVHWHGMHLPAAMDGGPHQVVDPGETWSPHWRIDQPAATLWYHPHLHGETEKHVAMGLAGMVILRDAQEAALNLPRSYGVDDIPVIVQDKRFDDQAQFTDGTRGFIGAIGDTLLVNGTVGPYLDVTTDVVRLRLLNASPARVYDFGFSDHRSFDMIASDGGLLTKPAPLTGIRLSPGERAEVLVRLTPGEKVTLRSTKPDLGLDTVTGGMNAGNDTLDVLQLRAAAALKPLGAMPGTLVPIERWSPDAASVTRTFDLSGHVINEKPMDMGRIDETVEVDTLEQWVVTNSMHAPHSFHVHDVQFQIASIGGAPPPPELAGWKDTIYLPPETEFRLLMRFTDYTSRTVPYMYHCHLLTHEDAGMMGQFVVVKHGQKAGKPPADTTTPSRTGQGPRNQEGHDGH